MNREEQIQEMSKLSVVLAKWHSVPTVTIAQTCTIIKNAKFVAKSPRSYTISIYIARLLHIITNRLNKRRLNVGMPKDIATVKKLSVKNYTEFYKKR
nr:MAG TPA: hypothetical protein [Caudoviricetes sp.]